MYNSSNKKRDLTLDQKFIKIFSFDTPSATSCDVTSYRMHETSSICTVMILVSNRRLIYGIHKGIFVSKIIASI